jgi:Protein similar to CwfJ C-terminus 1
MYAEDDKGVIFYETVISLKWQKHSVIECVPVPWEQFDVLPGYFKVRNRQELICPFFSYPCRSLF